MAGTARKEAMGSSMAASEFLEIFKKYHALTAAVGTGKDR